MVTINQRFVLNQFNTLEQFSLYIGNVTAV